MKQYELKSTLPIFPIDLESKQGDYSVLVQADSVSDGYHTMDELYDHRRVLSRCMFELFADRGCDVWKSKLHSDGTMFPGYFIVGMNHKRIGQISYHYDIKYWNDFMVTELDKAPEYDGHTSQDVIERLSRF